MAEIAVPGATIYYQTHGAGEPLLLLHAGWGTAVNGFDLQVAALSDRYRLIVPDRRGYGRSSRVERLDPDYHRQAVPDMLALLDDVRVETTHVWGHSDGAVVGAWLAILAPERVRSLVFEGGHLRARKDRDRSLAFMTRVREQPDTLPAELQAALAAGHGADYWRRLLWLWTEAWRLLYERGGDLYDGRLGEIRCPALVAHGGGDPHTGLAEIAELAAQIPGARTLFVQEAGHSLHDDPAFVDRLHAAVLDLLASA